MSKHEYACGACGHAQDSMDRVCDSCGAHRVVLISVLESIAGPNWRDLLKPEKKLVPTLQPTKKAKPLTPPDLKQCQAEKPNGVNFMTLGGRREMIRCTKKPTVIAIENKPGEDGQIGKMSLCDDCVGAFMKQMPKDYATFTPANQYDPKPYLELLQAEAKYLESRGWVPNLRVAPAVLWRDPLESEHPDRLYRQEVAMTIQKPREPQ